MSHLVLDAGARAVVLILDLPGKRHVVDVNTRVHDHDGAAFASPPPCPSRSAVDVLVGSVVVLGIDPIGGLGAEHLRRCSHVGRVAVVRGCVECARGGGCS